MREIKFRAWHYIGHGEVDYLSFATNHVSFSFIDKKSRKIVSLDCPIDDLIALEQFTGMLDKNGKEIYEGDIVENGADIIMTVIQGVGFEVGKTDFGVMIYSDGFALKFSDGSGYCSISGEEELEVIGNIHENPELNNEED
jgi:uncharacterized phage protein (TIGR01671 family)